MSLCCIVGEYGDGGSSLSQSKRVPSFYAPVSIHKAATLGPSIRPCLIQTRYDLRPLFPPFPCHACQTSLLRVASQTFLCPGASHFGSPSTPLPLPHFKETEASPQSRLGPPPGPGSPSSRAPFASFLPPALARPYLPGLPYRWHVFRGELVGRVRDEQAGLAHGAVAHHHALDGLHPGAGGGARGGGGGGRREGSRPGWVGGWVGGAGWVRRLSAGGRREH